MGKKSDSNVETEYWETITLTDPVTGKQLIQKVKITKYKTPDTKGKGIAEELEEDSIVPLPEDDFEEQE